jgi:hypothetical protein
MSTARFFRVPGQSLNEYGIAFALIVVVAIAGLVTLGNRSNQMLTQSNQVLFDNPGGGSGSARQMAGLLGGRPAPGLTQVQLRMADGTLLTLDNYPANLSKSIETVGGNGTTQLLLANLRSLAKQLVDQGKISQDEYNRMEALANQGHRLASIQKLLENAARSAPDLNAFQNTSLVFEGKIYDHPYDLAGLIDVNNESEWKNPELVNYLNSKGFTVSPKLNETGVG